MAEISRYVYKEYPRALFHVTGKTVNVHNDEEKGKYLAMGYEVSPVKGDQIAKIEKALVHHKAEISRLEREKTLLLGASDQPVMKAIESASHEIAEEDTKPDEPEKAPAPIETVEPVAQEATEKRGPGRPKSGSKALSIMGL